MLSLLPRLFHVLLEFSVTSPLPLIYLGIIVETLYLIAVADRFKQLVSPLCSFTMTDNHVLISKIQRAVVDSICPIEPMASAPAPAQTPASSMNVAVNNFIPDSIGWRKPNAD